MSELYIQAGMDVIAMVDPVVSQISPRHFGQLLSSPYKELFINIRNLGAFSSFFVCGDATKNIEPMCQTGPDSISIDENINLVAAKQITDRYNITLGGNIPLTTKLLLGNQQDNMAFVLDLLDSIDQQNFILSPGCDMPYDTPIENVIAVLQTVRDQEAARKILVNYQARQFNAEIVLPDYPRLKKPLIEVFTLDSDTCAACGYMLGSAKPVIGELKKTLFQILMTATVANLTLVATKTGQMRPRKGQGICFSFPFFAFFRIFFHPFYLFCSNFYPKKLAFQLRF